MARRKDRLDVTTFGQRIRLLESAVKARGGTQKRLAEVLGVSPRTLQRWKSRTDRPATAFGKVGDKLTRQERYEYRERAPRIKQPAPPSPRLRIAEVPRGQSPFGPDDALLAGPRHIVAAFSLTQEQEPEVWRRIRSIMRTGRPLVIRLGTAEGVDEHEIRTVTIPTEGLNSLQVQRLYFRQVREALAEAMGDLGLGSDEVGVSVLGITAG